MSATDSGQAAGQSDAGAVIVAWRRDEAGLSSRVDFVRRWSAQHVALVGSSHALCGARIPWLYEGPGDGHRCPRCYGIAARRGYVTEHGDPLVPSEDGG